MNLKITLQTLRRIERLLDGWQSSGDIPAIERDLACDLLRRAYDDIFFSDRSAATAPEAPLAEAAEAVAVPVAETASAEIPAKENTPAETPVETPAKESVEADAPAKTPVVEVAEKEILIEEFGEAGVTGEAGDTVEEAGDAASPAEDVATSIPDTSADIVIDPVFEVFTDEDEDAEEPDGTEKTEDAVASEDAETAEAVNLAQTVNIVEAVEAVGEAEDTETAEDMEVVEDMDEMEAGEMEADEMEVDEMEVVEVVEMEVTDADDTEIEHPDAAPAAAPAAVHSDAAPAAVRPVAATAATATPAAVHPDAAPVAETASPVAPAPAAKPGPESVLAAALAETSAEGTAADVAANTEPSAEQTRADAAASAAETLEEMAARFKNASGRRRKSRRAFMSLYDDDEPFRRGAQSDQLELSDWGVAPSGTSAKLRHTRELFGLPADDPDTALEQAPQPAAETDTADGEMEMEIIDFMDDDDPAQHDRPAKPSAESPVSPATEPASAPTTAPVSEPTSEPMSEPTSEPTATPTITPTEPIARPTAAPAREECDDADDDLSFDEAIVALDDLDDAPDSDDAPSAVSPLESSVSPEHSEPSESSESPGAVSFDSIEIVEIAEGDDVTPEIEEDKTQHPDRTEVADEPARTEAAAPAPLATESAAVHTLYDHEEKAEMPASTTVLGEVMGHDVPTVADTLGHRPDVAGWTEVDDDLNHAISVGDRFVLLRDLFDGDQALCDRTLKRLSTFDDLDDCMIWITENFAWNANSEGAKLIMGLLERKLG